jgi:hypothetical protein
MRILNFVLAVVVVVLGFGFGCGPGTRDEGGDNVDADEGPCVGIECQIVNCAKRGLPETTISGTVFAPNGTLALYGAQVYVPLLDPGPFQSGVSCQRCESQPSGGAASYTTSGVDGKFTLMRAPSGQAVPLFITIGKWRRKVILPTINECTDNPLPPMYTSLPKHKTEGDIPKIAISTGGCDALECLVRKLGLHDSEFSTPAGTGSIHLYSNGGAAKFADNTMFPTSDALWGDMNALAKYDIILNSCECSQNAAGKTQQMMDNMKQYADIGGRLFLSHYHNVWIDGEKGTTKKPQVWPEIATCDQIDQFPTGSIGVIDQQANPKGPAFASWMQAVGGSQSNGLHSITEQRLTCNAIDATKAERWLYLQGTNELQTFQFTTPNEVIPDDRCGKVVFSDMHVASGSTSSSSTAFPMGCNAGGMTAQEKALAFMLFDISSCVGEIL